MAACLILLRFSKPAQSGSLTMILMASPGMLAASRRLGKKTKTETLFDVQIIDRLKDF